MQNNKTALQLIWGLMLTLAGIGVFFRIPQVMPRIESIPQFSSIIPFIYFCFYLIGIILVVGGVKKIFGNLNKR
ncbi:MAG: hypothetical protein WA151_21745 [Desulfatirhabdiaceae bacterium]